MKFSIAKMITVVAAAFALGGCVAYHTPPEDRRITIAPDLGDSVWVTDVRMVVGAQSRHYEMQANLVNNTDHVVKLEYNTIWLNAAGMEIPTAMSVWRFTSLAPREVLGLKSIAPTEQACDFRFYVQSPRPANM